MYAYLCTKLEKALGIVEKCEPGRYSWLGLVVCLNKDAAKEGREGRLPNVRERLARCWGGAGPLSLESVCFS